METKLNLKLLLLFIVLTTLTIISGGFAHAKASSSLFSVAHKEYVEGKAVNYPVTTAEVSDLLVFADSRTKSLEQQMKVYHKVEELGFWRRWANSINIYEVRENYARQVLSHLNAMTEVFKIRRMSGNRFSSISEFQFKILLRQSEFLLNTPTTKNNFTALSRKSILSQKLDKAIYNYNQERLIFDSKMLAWNE